MSLPHFLHGPPRFDVGLAPIGIDNWLLPDDQAAWLVPKNALIDQRADEVFTELPSSRAAQQEAADMIAQVCKTQLMCSDPPLLAASRLVSDDLVVMEMHDGAWTTTACCLCSPTFFSAHHAIGKSLSALHAPVPDDNFGLSDRIGRVFTNMGPDTILERHNWTMQWSDARFTPDGAVLRDQAMGADIDYCGTHLHIRIERQTIRRLPETGGILFTIRIRLSPISQVLADRSHVQAFQEVWETTPQPVRAYKQWAVLERHVRAFLANI